MVHFKLPPFTCKWKIVVLGLDFIPSNKIKPAYTQGLGGIMSRPNATIGNFSVNGGGSIYLLWKVCIIKCASLK